MNNITIKDATEKDAAAIRSVYEVYVKKTAITFEYEVPTEAEFCRRIMSVKKKYPYLIAILNENDIVGYAYAKEFGERAAFSHSAETAIYVREDCRGRGIGTLLYEELERRLVRQNITNLYASIAYRAEEDIYLTHASPLFHQTCGFRKTAHFSMCGYKFGRWYDVIWMEKMIGPHEENAAPFLCAAELNGSDFFARSDENRIEI